MKYKNIMILAIFLVSLLAISTVSAQDNATSDVVSVEETTDEVVSAENNNQIISVNESDVGTFDDLAKEINSVEEGGFLNLTKDYKYVSGPTDGIQINKTITINGQGHTIDGNNLSIVFYAKSRNCVFKNILFVNGFSNEGYSSIHGGRFNVFNCTFVNNWEGAIIDGGYSNISYCTFINNSAKYGGAVWSGSYSNISYCSFINNYAQENAGALSVGMYSNVSYCTFINNTSKRQTGALYVDSYSTISHSTFENNIAKSSMGGAICSISSTNIKILNNTFINNDANYGGAIHLSGENYLIAYSTFSSSTGSNIGSAIDLSGDNSKILNSTFINNKHSNMGLIYIDGDNNIVTNSCFIKNEGHEIYVTGDKNLIANSSFFENYGDAGNIYLNGNNGILTNCTFSNNSILNKPISGSAVCWSGNNGIIKYCSFINNEFIGNGGAINCFGDKLTISKNLFINNSIKKRYYSSSANGGAIYCACNNCIIVDCLFKDNYAVSNNGGAIYLIGNKSSVINCIFINNSVPSYSEGGAIYWKGICGELKNCSFINNSAYGGSGISLNGNGTNIMNCSFVNNSAYGAAGAVYCDAKDCVFMYSSFVNNFAAELAGAIFLTKNNNTIENCSFVNNSANDGGSIIIKDDNNRLINCIFRNNNASRFAGSIYLINNGCILENCSFVNNSANDGGAILIQGNNTILKGSSFDNNYAVELGGATYFIGFNGSLINNSFNNNYANNGGAIFWQGNNGTVTDCVFTDNYAPNNGSSVYWFGDNGNLANSIVIDNNMSNQVYWWNTENGNIENCKFINNTNGVINKGAKFSRNNISLSNSNASFDFKNPETISVTLENVLDEFLINSTIAFNFVKNNILKEFNVNLSDNFASVCNELSDLEAGTWTVTAIFAGDDNYAPCNTTFTVTVNPIVCSLTIRVNDTEVDKETSIIVNVYDNINSIINEGSVVFFDGEKNIGESNVTDGVVTLIYTPLTAGEHLIIARYYANDYINNSISTNLNVEKIDSNIIISNIIFDYGSVGSADFSLDGAIGVNASIIDNNNAIVTIDENNIFVFGLDAGNYLLFVTTVPDANHNAVNAIANVTVNKIDSSISVEDMVFVYGGIGSSDVVLTGANSFIANVNSENAIVSIDGNVVTVSNLTGGSYVLEVTTIPDANHIAISKQANIVVNPINANLTANVSNIEFGSNAIVYIEINKEITGNVLIDGKEIIITNGKGIYTFINPNTGIHNVYIVFEGDNNFIADEKTVSFEVTKKSVPDNQNPFTPAKTDDEKQPNNPSYTIALNEDATGILTVTIGDKTFSKELVNGKATVEVDGVPAGDYVAIITYSGDDNYDSISRTVNATVKVDPEITASNAKVTYATGKYYTIKVNGIDGKLVNGITVNITGQISKTLTTTDGIAKFKVTQKPGTYKLNITALGKSVTKTLTVKHLVTLKSVTVKKSAKKLVLQATLGKVKGKYLKGKTITFKFNGKTYKAKTDKKGVAKVTIKSSVLKKLKVGKKVTYQATYLKDTVKKTTKIKK